MRGSHPRREGTGLLNLPLKGFTQNQVWCEIAALACDLLAWAQMLALVGKARPELSHDLPASKSAAR
jgi:hypothetical protein